jgi:hypothetical protein
MLSPREERHHSNPTAAGKHDVVKRCYWLTVSGTTMTLPPPTYDFGTRQFQRRREYQGLKGLEDIFTRSDPRVIR